MDKTKKAMNPARFGRCYLCKSRNMTVIRRKLRHNIARNVPKCRDCGAVYLEPRTTDLRRYYTASYRKRYTPVVGKALTVRDTFDLYLPHQQARISEIKHILNPSMRVLDVGCSTGHFLYALKDHVRECVGIEFNKEEADFVKRKLGIKVFTKPAQETTLKRRSFDLISAWQVMEHMEDPRKFLLTIRDYLKPDGYLCIEVPNLDDALLSLYQNKAYADFWFREPHIFYFSRKTLAALLEQAGFRGIMKTNQQYGIFNHMNWNMTSKPQASFDEGTNTLSLAVSPAEGNAAANDLNRLFKNVDKEYKRLLVKYGMGENILFIGRRYA